MKMMSTFNYLTIIYHLGGVMVSLDT